MAGVGVRGCRTFHPGHHPQIPRLLLIKRKNDLLTLLLTLTLTLTHIVVISKLFYV